MKKILTVLFLLSISLPSVYAQISSLEQFQKTYSDYYKLNREYVHLHINKTTLLPNEDIWFSTYVYDLRSNLPNSLTTNLNITLFNSKGKQIETKTVFIDYGFGKGSFNISELNLTPGKYFLQSSTNYMKNFNEELTHIQSFEILGNKKTNTNLERKYDLQLLPESGKLLSSTLNTIAVKLIDETGKGVIFYDAKVYDKNKNLITSFKSNKFGLSKFSLNPKAGKSYNVLLKTEFGDTISAKVPSAYEKGVILKTNNLLPNDVFFSLETNNKTFKNIKNNYFHLFIHQNKDFKSLKFKLSKVSNNALSIKRDNLFPGINIVTVLDHDYNPILERIIYNPKNIKRNRFEAKILKNTVDSLEIEIKSSEPLDSLQNISIATLPSYTNAKKNNANILSTFLLKPYIKSRIEEPAYYFNHENKRKSFYDLDLLLLTQGWSSYDWKDILYFKPSENFKSESGFTLTGKVIKRNEKKNKQLFISSQEAGVFEIIDIENNNEFKTHNLYIIDSTEISIGLLNEKNNEIKETNYSVNILPLKKHQELKLENNFLNNFKKEKQNINTEVENFINAPNTLDTIVLKGKSKNQKEEDLSIRSNVTYIDDNLSRSYFYITDFIATQGFNVKNDTRGVSITSKRGGNLKGYSKPLVILNGMPLMNDYSILGNLLTSEVEKISINRSGFGYGIRGSGGVIEITENREMISKRSNNLFNFVAKNGFTTNKKFYIPKYSSYASDIFKNYGIIDWIPKFEVNKSKNTFKIPNTLTDKIILYIEGMSTDGYLISEEIELEP